MPRVWKCGHAHFAGENGGQKNCEHRSLLFCGKRPIDFGACEGGRGCGARRRDTAQRGSFTPAKRQLPAGSGASGYCDMPGSLCIL